MTDRWQSKVQALRRLIAPDSGATEPERETAHRKLEGILQNLYGADDGAKRYAGFLYAIDQDPTATDEALAAAFTASDWADMIRFGVSMEGSWTGRNPREAVQMMVADYARRLGKRKGQRRLADG
jgi:hypothetical protein